MEEATKPKKLLDQFRDVLRTLTKPQPLQFCFPITL